MNNKIQIDFHQISFDKHLAEETLKADKLNKALELIKLASEGSISTIDIDALNSFLNTCTGFRNVGMSAAAMGLDVEYQTIVDASKITSDFISLKEGKYIIDEDSLREFYTDYLTDAEADVYSTLMKAFKILNKVDSRYFQCVSGAGVDARKLKAITNVFFRR